MSLIFDDRTDTTAVSAASDVDNGLLVDAEIDGIGLAILVHLARPVAAILAVVRQTLIPLIPSGWQEDAVAVLLAGEPSAPHTLHGGVIVLAVLQQLLVIPFRRHLPVAAPLRPSHVIFRLADDNAKILERTTRAVAPMLQEAHFVPLGNPKSTASTPAGTWP